MVTTKWVPVMLLSAVVGGCDSEVVRDDDGSGASAASGSSSTAGTTGSSSDFTCDAMCADYLARMPECILEYCLDGCTSMLEAAEAAGCPEAAILCLEQFPVVATDCAGGCVDHAPFIECVHGSGGGS